MTGACPYCDDPCPEGARFCPSCGARLAAATRARSTERRIITTLFCDLVGYTAMSERADPEDVDAVLRSYYALARQVIEQFGGIVEKFVGDAVVGVFGVPAAHEDDAERGVRAAVRIQERIAELPHLGDSPLQARVGVNTGHTLVRLDVDPSSGQSFMVGDTINTASRLQTLAPPGGVVVGDLTHEMADHIATFEPMEPAPLKGKSEKVRVWSVTGGVSKVGIDLRREFPTPFIGREVELAVLTGLFEKARASATPQFAFIIAEAGLGKSRLVAELASSLDQRSDVLAYWRHAQCPAFGEGLSIWPLARVVREHAGLLEVDDDAVIEERLRAVLDDEPDRAWLAERLRPLLGLPAAEAPQEENFSAWLHFLELMARAHPTVLVFEDAHWASDTIAAFMRYVVQHIRNVPLLLIATARPEFHDRYPDYQTLRAGDERMGRIVELDLHPLSDVESDRLVTAMCSPDMGDIRSTITRQCGGNPLYAEELVHLVRERSATVAEDRDDHDHLLPTSLETLIAARLDSLRPDLKALVGDAAVIGERFWSGALTAVSGRDGEDVERGLDELVEREFIRRGADQSAVGERDVVFWHALTRDVAYRQLTRPIRVEKHEAVAHWLEDAADEGSAEVGVMLAHHYSTACQLLRDMRDPRSADLVAPAVRYLAGAGEHELSLDASSAERRFARALELAPQAHQQRGALQVKWGEALAQTGHLQEAEDSIRQGVDALLAQGNHRAASVGLTHLSWVLGMRGDERVRPLLDEALTLVGTEASVERLAVLVQLTVHKELASECEQAILHAEQALLLAAELRLPTPFAARHYRALALCDLGRPAGLADLQHLLTEARQKASGSRELPPLYFNLAEQLLAFEGPDRAYAVCEEGLHFALEHRNALAAAYLESSALNYRMWLGQWPAVLADYPRVATLCEEQGETWDLKELQALAALLSALTGRFDDAKGLAVRAEKSLLATFSEGTYGSTKLPYVAAAWLALGQPAAALRVLQRFEALCERQARLTGPGAPFTLRTAVLAGDEDMAKRMAKRMPAERDFERCSLASYSSLKAERAGDLDGAAELYWTAAGLWRKLGVPYEEALALLGQGRCLASMDRRPDAVPTLTAARETFSRLDARPVLAEAEKLIAESA